MDATTSNEEEEVAKYVKCDACGGATMRGETDDELIVQVQAHDKEAHGRDTTRAQVLLLARKEPAAS